MQALGQAAGDNTWGTLCPSWSQENPGGHVLVMSFARPDCEQDRSAGRSECSAPSLSSLSNQISKSRSGFEAAAGRLSGPQPTGNRPPAPHSPGPRLYGVGRVQLDENGLLLSRALGQPEPPPLLLRDDTGQSRDQTLHSSPPQFWNNWF